MTDAEMVQLRYERDLVARDRANLVAEVNALRSEGKGLVARIEAILDDHEDCFPGAPIHETHDNECVDDCAGCCADDVIRRIRLLLTPPGKSGDVQ